MEVNFKETIADFRQFLRDSGEDDSDYSDEYIEHLIEAGV